MKQLMRFKQYIGSLILFSFVLQSAAPLCAAAQSSTSPAKANMAIQTTVPTKSPQTSIADSNLNTLIKTIVEDATSNYVAENISESLKRCYRTLSQGVQELPVEDIWQVMPDILRYAVEQQATRAARPGLSSAPVVGPGTCDLTEVLSGLSAIINRIGCTTDSVCCNTILGILGDACGIFGPDCSISCKLQEIMEEIIETQSIIVEILEECCSSIHEDIMECCTSLHAQIEIGFDGTFSVLNSIETNLEECCESLSEDIEKCCNNIDENISECCKNLHEDIEIGFNATFTILNSIENLIEECCSNIHEDITECCESLHEDIINTQTIIIEAIDNLCAPTPLRQKNVVAGILQLTESGNYKFCEDITATLIISGSLISVDMNNRCLFGLVSISGDNDTLANGFIQAPAPTTDAPAAINIQDNALNTCLLHLTITCADSTELDANNNGLDGRDGIFSGGIQVCIADCHIQTGAGARGGDSIGSPNNILAGNGGNGGNGIISLNNNIHIVRTSIITGNGADGGNTALGGALKQAGNAGNSGIGIHIIGTIDCIISSINCIAECTIFTGSGGNGGQSACSDGGNGGNSGDGIINNCKDTEIRSCTIRTGNGGDGGTGTNGSGGDGGHSGNAITTQGTQIANVILSTGNAGSGADGATGGPGGNAGYGVFVNGACECQVREIIVESTGNGGKGGNSLQSQIPGNGGDGGNGGDAVHITQSSRHTEVRLSTFSRTGLGGLGGNPGTDGGIAGINGFPGRAITDLNTDPCSIDPLCTTTYFGPSAIFENFAYAIADTSIRYLINGKLQESGKASDTSCNRLDNVYVDCNVNVTYDICAEIYATQTILYEEIQEGFNGTFTMLNAIENSLLECCANLHEDITECCENIEKDIFATQTILSKQITTGFNDTFTTLNTIETTLNECCGNIQENITECCDSLHEDITKCCENIEGDIFATQTILSKQITTGFNDTFTTLNTIETTLNECCGNIQENIIECCDSLHEDITKCCENIEEDIFATQTQIRIGFNDTFTILNNIEEQINECCTDIHEDINECCESLHEDIINTQTTIIEAIDNLCAPTPLRQKNVVAGILQLTASGNYKFCEDITATLIISGSLISVDLNNRCLFGLVSISGDNDTLANGFVQAPAPTTDAPAAVSIENSALNTCLLHLTITCADSTELDLNNNGLDGRDGISNSGLQTLIADCHIQTGAGARGGDSLGSPNNVPAGNGGSGGSGIISLNNNIQIVRTSIVTGNGNDGGNTDLGASLGQAGSGGNSGTGIEFLGIIDCTTSNINCIAECTIYTGNGGNGGQSGCCNGGNGGSVGDGIFNNCKNTEIKNCTIRTGNGGNGGIGTNGTGGNGGNSGNGITTQGTQIANIILSTGNAGNGADGATGGQGGNAGYGVFVNGACECQMREVIVESTGNGGNGGNSLQSHVPGNGGNGGNGGDAIHITQSSRHTEVRLSTFSRTGIGGLGGSAGTDGGIAGTNGFPGRAITDLNTDPCSVDPLCTTTYFGPSAIFENFAYAIADTSIRYLINGKVQESGKASDASCNRLDNVYVDCNVNVTYDICAEIYATQTILYEEIQEGFNDTFTTLSAIENSLLECCANLHEDITECCESIEEEIFATQTTLFEQIKTGFNDTFTTLNNIEDRINECCENIQENITECCDSLHKDITECCESIEEDILTTQTTLFAQIKIGFNDTFTTLNTIETSITECCETIQENVTECCDNIQAEIAQCCESLEEDILATKTTLSTQIETGFNDTFTVLSTIEMTLEECCSGIQEDIATCCDKLQEDLIFISDEIATGFNDTFILLNDIEVSLEECCDMLHEDISECCGNIQEDIAKCCDSLQEDIIDTRNILYEEIEIGFNDTFTVLNNLTMIVEDCCSNIHEDITECCEALHEDIINTQTIIIEAIDDLCAPTPLRQKNVIAGILQLTESGNYKFCEDITATLIISGSLISVDMNNRCLFGLAYILGENDTLANGFVQAPAPTTDAPAGVNIEAGALNTRLLCLAITCADSTALDSNNNGISGRDGIYNNGIQTLIADCSVHAGAGGQGGDAQVTPVVLSTGNGGNGGNGIISLQSNIQIIRTTVSSGNGGNAGSTCIGRQFSDAGNAGNSGIGIQILVQQACMACDISCIVDCVICTGNGGNGGYSCCNNGGNGGSSGDGIFNTCKYTEIRNCTIRTGNGGAGGLSDTDNGGNGGNSGNAITTQGTQIINVILSTGNAGNGGSGVNGGTGGNAGYGVFINDACECQVREVVVESTGNGGQGGNSTQTLMQGNGGNGGNGGDAIYISQGSRHTEVRLSTFSRTGLGGLGGTPGLYSSIPGTNGLPGRAVTDLNNDPCSTDPLCTTTYFGPSAIFENFAYAIADTSIRYLINGKNQESGKASDASCNRLDNVYVACDVNVTFDICEEIFTTQTILSEQIIGINNTINECCTSLHLDILDTQTILGNELDPVLSLAGVTTCADVQNLQGSIISFLKTIIAQQLSISC